MALRIIEFTLMSSHGILFLAIILFIDAKKPEKETKLIDYSNFQKKDYVMTQAELKFYRELKKITDKLELSIFPQVQLERIISVKNNNRSYRNRIKSRSIDYTIVTNKNCKIVCCIELDDYTHNYNNRVKRDEFINQLFFSTGIKLYRYNLKTEINLIEQNIKECL